MLNEARGNCPYKFQEMYCIVLLIPLHSFNQTTL
jgi:hypothetical protein